MVSIDGVLPIVLVLLVRVLVAEEFGYFTSHGLFALLSDPRRRATVTGVDSTVRLRTYVSR
jgi:hypothetical protein